MQSHESRAAWPRSRQRSRADLASSVGHAAIDNDRHAASRRALVGDVVATCGDGDNELEERKKTSSHLQLLPCQNQWGQLREKGGRDRDRQSHLPFPMFQPLFHNRFSPGYPCNVVLRRIRLVIALVDTLIPIGIGLIRPLFASSGGSEGRMRLGDNTR